MFKQNIQKDYHNKLASFFNRKKPIEKEVLLFQNIKSKINHTINFNLKRDTYKRENVNSEDNDNNSVIPVTEMYQLNNIKTSTNIHLNNLNMKNSDNIAIPKIQLKEMMIPTYSDNDEYDINNINKNINQSIEMDIYNIEETNIDADVNKLHRRKVSVINNVYQEAYTENTKPTGFGDFIRGCFFLLQFCSKYKFKSEIVINHPIAIFLEKFYKLFFIHQRFNVPILRLTSMFTENNWKDSKFDTANYIVDTVIDNKIISKFVHYLCSLKVINNNIFSYNIMFPSDEISEDHKQYMRHLLEPTEEMKTYVDDTLVSIGYYKNCFSVIHIRSGDKYLNDDTKIFDSSYYTKLVYEINILINSNSNIPYLLLADNNEIKLLLSGMFPNLKVLFKSITHLGEGTLLEREKVKNTLLDFYLMSHANSIYSYTCHAHGSGFSYWCAKTYNIPHKCMFIRVSK